MNSNRIDAIQGLRAIAALLVVFDHAVIVLQQKADVFTLKEQLAWHLGATGVWLFFMISGFIMITSSHEQFGKLDSTRLFLLRRFARIAPLYWIATSVYAVKLMLAGAAPSVATFMQSLWFLPYRNAEGLMQPILGVGWTLNYEMLFYVLFAIALRFPFRSGIPLLLLALITVSAGGSAIATLMPSGTALDAITFWSNPKLLLFASGMVLGLVRLQLKKRGGLVLERLAPLLTISLGLIVVSSVLVYERPVSHIVSTAVCFFVVLSCAITTTPATHDLAAGLVTGSSARSGQTGPTAPPVRLTADSSRARLLVVLLGDASYSIYLVHSFVSGPLGRIWARYFQQSPPWIFFIAMIVASCLAGVATYAYLEKPLTKFFLKKIKPRGRPVSIV